MLSTATAKSAACVRSVAEEIGLIVPHESATVAEFPSSPPLAISVNISAKDFAQPDLASAIGKTLEQTGVDPGCLQLEIIETIAMGMRTKSGHVLVQLKALGVPTPRPLVIRIRLWSSSFPALYGFNYHEHRYTPTLLG
jgi:EAL domain-containing protein (putative c-di-GMP-specific phosphodiesterase class I)